MEGWGYPDSGLHGTVDAGFADRDVAVLADRLIALCEAERADVLVGYDPAGGYGHPDHVQVHQVVRAARAGCGRPPGCSR